MVTSKTLIEDFKSSGINFNVTRYKWTETNYPSLNDIGFVFEYKNKKFNGRGAHEDVETALLISIMEAIERCACYFSDIKTSGVAAHINLESAKFNAKKELIERDVALCHYLTQTKMKVIQSLNPEILNSLDKFKSKGVDIKFYKLSQVNEINSVLAFAFGERSEISFGLILGLGSGLYIENAIKSAFIECVRNVSFILSLKKNIGFDLNEFIKNQFLPSSHFKFALDKNTPNYLKSFFVNCNENLVENINDFFYESLDIINPAESIWTIC